MTRGDHTISLRFLRPVTMSAATLSAVVEKGAGSIPVVILVWTKPGLTTMTWTPEP